MRVLSEVQRYGISPLHLEQVLTLVYIAARLPFDYVGPLSGIAEQLRHPFGDYIKDACRPTERGRELLCNFLLTFAVETIVI